MEYGLHFADDPLEHTSEPETFEVKLEVVAGSFGEACLMNPDPDVAQYQSDRDKEQPQARTARAGVDAGLPHLAIAGFDAEAPAVALANLGGKTLDPPGGE